MYFNEIIIINLFYWKADRLKICRSLQIRALTGIRSRNSQKKISYEKKRKAILKIK